jgi:hypothetical protein
VDGTREAINAVTKTKGADMTGYESKRAAAQDRVNYGASSNYPPQPAQAEQCNYPDCKCPTENPCLKGLAQPAQEPASVTYKEVADTMNALRKGTVEQRQISAEMENKRLDTAPQQPAQEPVAWMNKHGDCKSAVFREAEAGAKEEYNIPLYTNQTLEKNT